MLVCEEQEEKVRQGFARVYEVKHEQLKSVLVCRGIVTTKGQERKTRK